MKLQPLPKDLQIYQAAKQFSIGAGVIHKHTRIPDTMMFAIQPFVTCATFSLELYLKCILAIEGQTEVKGHKVAKLFEKISIGSKNGVLFFVRGAYANLELPLTFIEEHIRAMDNAFVDWRYLHEVKTASLDLQFLSRIVWACQEHIKNLRPEWWANKTLNPDAPNEGV